MKHLYLLFLCFLFSCNEIIDVTEQYRIEGVVRKNTEISAITLHHSAGKKLDLDYMHDMHIKKKFGGIAYHFVIDIDGTIYQTRPESMCGSHMLNHNTNNIGICFIGNYEEKQFPASQLYAGRFLIRYLINKYPSIKTCYYHKYLNTKIKKHTDCPGKNFPQINDFLPKMPIRKSKSASKWYIP